MKKLGFLALIAGVASALSSCGYGVTGPLIMGNYLFDTYEDELAFYEVFKHKNSERFLLPNYDNGLLDGRYYFECEGIRGDIIQQNIWDYDFPFPSFHFFTSSISVELISISGQIEEGELFSEDSFYAVAKGPSAYSLYVESILIGCVSFGHYYNSVTPTSEDLDSILQGFKNVYCAL